MANAGVLSVITMPCMVHKATPHKFPVSCPGNGLLMPVGGYMERRLTKIPGLQVDL